MRALNLWIVCRLWGNSDGFFYVCRFQRLSPPRFVASEVCRFQGLSPPRFVTSEVCRLRGLSLPRFVASEVCRFLRLSIPMFVVLTFVVPTFVVPTFVVLKFVSVGAQLLILVQYVQVLNYSRVFSVTTNWIQIKSLVQRAPVGMRGHGSFKMYLMKLNVWWEYP